MDIIIGIYKSNFFRELSRNFASCGMYVEASNRCSDRIVSIDQPHVRPIVRRKTGGKRVEFGAKLGLSLFKGYLTHQILSWDAYNEISDLQDQAETYRLLTGHYPELIQCDKIYHTNDNRPALKPGGKKKPSQRLS